MDTMAKRLPGRRLPPMDDLEDSELSDHQPTLEFQEGSYSLPELLESHLLPVVAQYDCTRQPVPFNEYNFDLSQPLLLYKKRNIQKVVARSLVIEDERYKDVGESLLIPEDYKGWFAVLQRVTGGICRADDSVPHFTSVEQLATSNTERFLVGGTKKLSGLQIMDRSKAQLEHEPRSFLPGDLLTIEKVYYGETRKRTRLFRKPKYITEKFLLCRDEADREVLLPFEQTGIFYQVSHKTGKAMKNVLQMSDIVARKLTPRIIKLVFGRFPVTPCSFTGLMRAESSKIETSIIACTIINTKNILLELPVSSDMHFRVATMNDDLRQNPCYRGAMSLCAERALTYMRNIKVCYNFAVEEDTDVTSSHPPLSQQRSSPLTETTLDKKEVLESFNRRRDHVKSDSEASLTRLPRVFSLDQPDDISIRPGRCASAGRMSFCLGNNYLTVPVPDLTYGNKRNSGNNNTIPEATYTTRRGSKISFNGRFFEEESEQTDTEEPSPESTSAAIPPAMPSTNIGAYMGLCSVQPHSIMVTTNPDLEGKPARSFSEPPMVSPPPLPRSSSTSTSGLSSRATSSGSEDVTSNRESTDSFEYAVPKTSPPATATVTTSTDSSSATSDNSSKSRVRRPSTFTFSEGCILPPSGVARNPAYETIRDEDETKSDDGSPIYENIQLLMEVVAEIEEARSDDFDMPKTNENSIDNIVNNQDIIKHDSDTEKCLRESFSEQVQTADTIVVIKESLDGEIKQLHDTNRESPVLDDAETLDTVCEEPQLLKDDNTSEDKALTEDNDSDDELDKESNCEEFCTGPIKIYITEVEDNTEEDKGDTNGECNVGESQDLDERLSMDDDAETTEIELRTSACLTPNTDDRASSARCSCLVDICETVVDENVDEQVDTLDECTSNPIKDKTVDPEPPILEENTHASESECVENNIEAVVDNDTNTRDASDITDAVETSVVHTNNVRPSDRTNLWRQTVEEMLSSDNDVKLTLVYPRRVIEPSEKALDELNAEEIAEQLRVIGIKNGSIQKLKGQGVDGQLFQQILDGESCLRECLRGINLIDQQKISMFIRGWRPGTE